MFKREMTTIQSGDYRANNALRGADYLASQPVKIIKELPETDEDGDRFRVQTFAGYMYDVPADVLSPHPSEPELNTEFVERLMTFGSPLMQPFIIQAIEAFAVAVLKAPAKTPEEDTGFVSDRAWRECAQFTLGQYVARDETRKARSAVPA